MTSCFNRSMYGKVLWYEKSLNKWALKEKCGQQENVKNIAKDLKWILHLKTTGQYTICTVKADPVKSFGLST